MSTDDKRLFKVLHLTVGAPFEEVGYSCAGGGGEQQLCVYDQAVVAAASVTLTRANRRWSECGGGAAQIQPKSRL